MIAMRRSKRIFAMIIAAPMMLGLASAFAQVPDTEVIGGPNAPAASAPAIETSHSSVKLDKDSAAWVGHHHYNSDAERAQDDLIITEVKSALAEDGISKDYPVEVDADHGRVTLNGVVASRDDVKAAAEAAKDVQGVVAVRNLLRPH
jgi:osmotically-inducible protein OsmY